jgi:ankyrin repeat protein
MLTDFDAARQVALHLAALKGNPDVCEELLRHGAMPDAPKPQSRTTALHRAAKTGNVELCNVLLKVYKVRLYFVHKGRDDIYGSIVQQICFLD